MKIIKILLMVLLTVVLSITAFAEDDEGILSIYEGSELVFDDIIGYEELPIVMDEETVTVMEGILRRQWCEAPKGRSPLEIIRNYERAINLMGGEVLFVSRDPQSIKIDERKLSDIFNENRVNRGLSTNVMTQNSFPGLMSEYLLGKIMTPETDTYVIIGAGNGHWAANQDDRTFFEIVSLKTETMEMGMVTADALQEGLAVYGRVAVYNIYFDTAEFTVKAESTEALGVIAEFLQENTEKKYLVVGHTDNVGSYDMNLNLSEARAKAVVEKLINKYGINEDLLMAVGVGPASPVISNSTEEGRAQNRRVEIVEM